SHFLLYVRYSAAGWQGDMDLPPQPLKHLKNTIIH
ncbi:hypothetical protein ACUODF_15765, partial [Escherichia coli]